MEIVNERNSHFCTEESVKIGRDFIPRNSDIFIATYPKSGTTWVSHILHSLRSNGDTTFNEITEVVPWDVTAFDCGQNVNDDQKYSPRLFKSHEPFNLIAKNKENVTEMCRYVHVARNPLDVFVSFYHFLPLYFDVELDKVTMTEFCDKIFTGLSHSGIITNFFVSYYEAMLKYPKNIYWIFYEDLKLDVENEINKLVKWLDMKVDKELMKLTLAQASFQWMKDHESKFDDHFVFNQVKKRCGLSHLEKPRNSKVRKGDNNESKIIPETVKQKIDENWKEIVTAKIGFQNYLDMKSAVKTFQYEHHFNPN